MSDEEGNESEGPEHKELRENLQEILVQLELEYRSSHDNDSSKESPAIYITDPKDENNTKTGCQISQPDIFIEKEDCIDIIEIENVDEDKKGESPKHILGNIYNIHNSKFYRDEMDEPKEIRKDCRLIIILTKDKPTKGSKNEQYEHIVDSINFENGILDELKIFWKDELNEIKEYLDKSPYNNYNIDINFKKEDGNDKKVVFFLGAGFSKDAGIPLQNELLPKALFDHYLDEDIKEFLKDIFDFHYKQGKVNGDPAGEEHQGRDRCRRCGGRCEGVTGGEKLKIICDTPRNEFLLFLVFR
ncbi:MAG: hypothetical protein KGY68_07930 [Candidatus Thermoplasmatota archaeon]|nr:hypothetical protein [Candidatus Thermoplasmatota archaeon]